MTPEEQLINDILVLEERRQYLRDDLSAQQRIQEHEKITARQLRAVQEYAKEKAVGFADYLNSQNLLVNKEAAMDCYDEWNYTKNKKQ